MNFREFFLKNRIKFIKYHEFVEGLNFDFKTEFDNSKFKVLIVRLSEYKDVSKSFSHLLIYSEIKKISNEIFVDFSFLPPLKLHSLFSFEKIPLMVGRRSFYSSDDFDLILISNSHLLELLNLPYLFKNSGIPIYNKYRDEKFPPIILGGLNASLTLPLFKSKDISMVDGLFLGEGEEEIGKLVNFFFKNKNLKKDEILKKFSESSKHFYSPFIPEKEKLYPKILRNLKPIGGDFPLLNNSECDTSFLQISYGCPFFCSFCFEGFERKPYREIPSKLLIEEAKKIKINRGTEEINLFSLNFNSHKDICELLIELNKIFSRVSAKSQRIDLLYKNLNLLDILLLLGKRSFTFGIEGISGKIRKYYNKFFKNELILNFLKILLSKKIRELKLFYIISGKETEEDLNEFEDFLNELKEFLKLKKINTRIVLSSGYLVKMKHTPLFLDEGNIDIEKLELLAKRIRSICKKYKFEFRTSMNLDEFQLEKFLMRKPFNANLLLEEIYKRGDIFYTEKKLKEVLNLINKKKVPGSKLFQIEEVTGKKFINQFLKKIKKGKEVGSCFQSKCIGCNACSSDEKSKILNHKIITPSKEKIKEFEKIILKKRKYKTDFYLVNISKKFFGGDKKWINSSLFKEILKIYPDYFDKIFEVRESQFTTNEFKRKIPFFYGKTIFQVKYIGDNLNLNPPIRLENFIVEKKLEKSEIKKMEIEINFYENYSVDNILNYVDKFLRENYLTYTLIKNGDNTNFKLSKKSIKKGIFFKITLEKNKLKIFASKKVDLSNLIKKFEEGEILNFDISISHLFFDEECL